MKAISFIPLRNVALSEKLYFPPATRCGYRRNGYVFSILREFIYIALLKMRWSLIYFKLKHHRDPERWWFPSRR